MTPVSLLTCWIATSAGPSARIGVERALVDQPVRADRDDRRRPRPSHAARWHARSRHGPARRSCARLADDLDRLARAGGEDDVMTPAERLGDRRPRLPRAAARAARPSACGELGLAQRLERVGHRRPRFGKHRRGRGMVEIEPVVNQSKRADSCRLPVEAPPLYRSRRRGAPAPAAQSLRELTRIPCPK